MKREDIEKECEKYSQEATPSYVNGDFDRYAIAQSFEDGANWRINSVWHNATELPDSGKHVTAMLSKGGIVGGDIDATKKEIAEVFKVHGVIKWAYSEDLLPDKED